MFKLNWKEAACILLVLVAVFNAVLWYPSMPDVVVTHWDATGVANGWGPKWLGLFLVPMLIAVMYGFLSIIPYIEVLKQNVKKFYGYYENFKLILVAFLFAIYATSVAVNAGVAMPFGVVIFVGIGIVMYYAGVMTEHSKRNFFIGMRTPWTLSSDEVWDKTNRLGGLLLKVLGVLAVPLAFDGLQWFLVWMLLVVLAMIYLGAYSYLEFNKKKR
jgi:uncharacterized membrane protein